MTAHYIHPMLYRCDGRECLASAEGTNERLPDGWVSVVEGEGKGPGATHWYGHYCPKCAPEAPE